MTFWPGEGCYGVLPGPPTEALNPQTSNAVAVSGADYSYPFPILQTWSEADGSTGALLYMNCNDFSCSFTAHDVPIDVLLQIAGSVQTVG